MKYFFELESTDPTSPFQYTEGFIEPIPMDEIESAAHPNEVRVRHVFTEHVAFGIRQEDVTKYYSKTMANQMMAQDGTSLVLDLDALNAYLLATTTLKIKGK